MEHYQIINASYSCIRVLKNTCISLPYAIISCISTGLSGFGLSRSSFDNTKFNQLLTFTLYDKSINKGLDDYG